MKRFIVLVDLSPSSTQLLKYAYNWSLFAKAKLLAVHEASYLVPSLVDNQTRQEIISSIKQDTLQELKTAAMTATNQDLECIICENTLEETLKQLTTKPDNQLVFMGLKATGALKKIFLGSKTLSIIEETNSVVVAIPWDLESFNPQKIFVAVGEKFALNKDSLENFLSFVSPSIAIEFFYLAAPKEQTEPILKILKDLSLEFGSKFNTSYKIYEGENPFEDIKKVINNKTDELLVVQKGSRLFSDFLFRKFLVNELVFEGKNPLMVLP